MSERDEFLNNSNDLKEREEKQKKELLKNQELEKKVQKEIQKEVTSENKKEYEADEIKESQSEEKEDDKKLSDEEKDSISKKTDKPESEEKSEDKDGEVQEESEEEKKPDTKHIRHSAHTDLEEQELERDIAGRTRFSKGKQTGDDLLNDRTEEEEPEEELSEEDQALAELQAKQEAEREEHEARKEQFREANERALRYQEATRLGNENYQRNRYIQEQNELERASIERANSILESKPDLTKKEDDFMDKYMERLANDSDKRAKDEDRVRLSKHRKNALDKDEYIEDPLKRSRGLGKQKGDNALSEEGPSLEKTTGNVVNSAKGQATNIAQEAGPSMGQESSAKDESRKNQNAKRVAKETFKMMKGEGGGEVTLDGVAVQLTKNGAPLSVTETVKNTNMSQLMDQMLNVHDKKTAEENTKQAVQVGVTQVAKKADARELATSADKMLNDIDKHDLGGKATKFERDNLRTDATKKADIEAKSSAKIGGQRSLGKATVKGNALASDKVGIHEGSGLTRNTNFRLAKTPGVGGATSQAGIVGSGKLTLKSGSLKGVVSENAGAIGQLAGQMIKSSTDNSNDDRDKNPSNLAKSAKKYYDKLKVKGQSGSTDSIVAKGIVKNDKSSSNIVEEGKNAKSRLLKNQTQSFGRKNAERRVVSKNDGAMRIVREGHESGIKDIRSDAPGILKQKANKKLTEGKKSDVTSKFRKGKKSASEEYKEATKRRDGNIRLGRDGKAENPSSGDSKPKDLADKINSRRNNLSTKLNNQAKGKMSKVGFGRGRKVSTKGSLNQYLENIQKQGQAVRKFWMKNGVKAAGQQAQTNFVGKVVMKKAIATVATSGMSAGALAGSSAMISGAKGNADFEVIAASVYDSESDTTALTQDAVDMLQARFSAYNKKAQGKDVSQAELKKAGADYTPLIDIPVPKTMNGKPVRANVKFKFVDRDGNNIDKDKFMLDEYSDLVMPKDAVNSAGIGGASGELSSTDTGHPFNVPYVISQGLHNFAALDLAVPEGTPIYAVSDGTVVESNTQTAYMHINGNYLRHTLPNGETIYYGHMQQEPLLKVGDTVKKGQQIGFTGHTGLATGPHVHFDIRYPDASVPGGNPWKLLPGVPYGAVGITVDPATSKGPTPDTESKDSGESKKDSGSSNKKEDKSKGSGDSSSSQGKKSNAKKNSNGETQMDVMLNMLGALETGGQVYGQRDYGNFINAELAAEVTATLGWSSMYGENGRKWLERFKSENPDLFSKLDEGGQVAPVLNIGWEQSRWNANPTQKASIVNMLTTDQGRKLQDQMTAEREADHWKYCVANYTDNMRAVAWFTNIAELAGRSVADYVFQAANGNYSLDNLYNITMSRTGAGAIGDAMYHRRHSLYKQWIEEHYAADEKCDVNNIEVTGAGAINGSGSNPNSGSDSRAGQTLLIKEILAMSAIGSHYGQPNQEEDYFKYCIEVMDNAFKGKDGKGIDIQFTEQKDVVIANVEIKVLCDLYELEKMDKKFHTWDTSNEQYGDRNPQAYMALPNKDFEEIFNVKIKPVASGSEAGGGGGSGLPYLKWALQVAEDDSHGYSQVHRNGDPDYDCSSFIWYALNQSGFDVGTYAFATPSMPSVLQAAGFEMYTITSADQLQPGDILLKEGHTEIYIGDGKTVGAHCDENGGITGPMGGDQGVAGLGIGEISVIPLDISGWTWGFHPPKDYVEKYANASGAKGDIEFGPDGLLKEEPSELGQKVINQLFAIPGGANGGQLHKDWGIDDNIDQLTTAQAIWVIHRIEGAGFGQTGDGLAGSDTPAVHQAFVERQLNRRFNGSVHELLKHWGTYSYNGY
mgnify:CR=1 FL=1